MEKKEEKKSKNKKLEELLFYKKESAWNDYSEKETHDVTAFSEEYKKFINLGQNFPFLFRTEILEYIATDEFKNETEIIQDDPISDKYGYRHVFEMIEKKYKLINDELYMRSLKKEINDDIHYI